MLNKFIQKIFKSRSRAVATDLNNFILKNIEKDIVSFNVVFDIGCYHGAFSESILKINPKATIHCFEPYNEAFSIIQNKFNDFENVVVNNLAVSNFSGESYLNINAFKETNSLLTSSDISDSNISSLTKTSGVQFVNTITIDSYCEMNKIKFIDLIKIDAQGNSFNVLKGLEKMLQNRQIQFLYVEAEFIEIYDDEKLFHHIVSYVCNFNYRILDLCNLSYDENNCLAWCDIIFQKI